MISFLVFMFMFLSRFVKLGLDLVYASTSYSRDQQARFNKKREIFPSAVSSPPIFIGCG